MPSQPQNPTGPSRCLGYSSLLKFDLSTVIDRYTLSMG